MKNVYGAAQTDEATTQQLAVLKQLKEKGKPLEYYIDKRNCVKVRHNGGWKDMQELSHSVPELAVAPYESPYVLTKVWTKEERKDGGAPIVSFHYKYVTEE